MPIMDIKELNSRYDVVQHFLQTRDDLDKVQEYVGEIGDLERIISRAATGRIAPREVMQLGRGLSRMEPIAKLCKGHGVKALDTLVGGMKNCSELLERISGTMTGCPLSASRASSLEASRPSERCICR